MKRVLTVLGVILGLLALSLAAAFLYFIGVTRSQRLDPAKLALSESYIAFCDASGNEIATGAHEAVLFDDLPAYVPNAFVSVEDKRFYGHKGFDVKRIGKALLKNISAFSFREGASTISQQLIKNTHLTSEKTVTRKLKEFKLTAMLEKRYTKKQILELYLNSIYFGHSAYGIGDAAHYYFGKKPEELLPAEGALLAALVKSPNRYSPFRDAEACLTRRNFVLKLMREQGYLDEAAYDEACAAPIPARPHPLLRGNSYLSLVYDELETLFPGIRSGTYGAVRVETAYEPALQEKLDGLQADSDLVALVIDAQKDVLRAIRTTVGLPKRPPASTIKPLLVYGPAIEENLLSPATPVLDAKTNFGGYRPDDASGATGQYLSARYALSHSVNIPAVKILNALGVERGAAYLRRMGLDVDREDRTLALALGGMREGFDLKSLADGYAALANGGTYAASGTIVRVTNRKGDTLYERTPFKTKVFSEETSFLVTDMLKTAATEGTARKLKSLPFAVAAKTGTNEGARGNLDAYTMAYTTEDVVAVWMGNADNSPVNASGGGLPANAAKDILAFLYKNSYPSDFAVPSNAVRLAYDKETYEKEHRIVRADPAAPLLTDPEDYFKTSAVPTEQCMRFSRPTIALPSISVKNGTVNIVLCQTEYYDYIVKRENRGHIATIYSGSYCECICDNSVEAGESYRYTVIPFYKEHEGEARELPLVKIEATSPIPDDWWE